MSISPLWRWILAAGVALNKGKGGEREREGEDHKRWRQSLYPWIRGRSHKVHLWFGISLTNKQKSSFKKCWRMNVQNSKKWSSKYSPHWRIGRGRSEVLSDRIFYTMNSDPTKRRRRPHREGGGRERESRERGRQTSCLADPRIKCSRFKNEQLPHSVHFPCMERPQILQTSFLVKCEIDSL